MSTLWEEFQAKALPALLHQAEGYRNQPLPVQVESETQISLPKKMCSDPDEVSALISALDAICLRTKGDSKSGRVVQSIYMDALRSKIVNLSRLLIDKKFNLSNFQNACSWVLLARVVCVCCSTTTDAQSDHNDLHYPVPGNLKVNLTLFYPRTVTTEPKNVPQRSSAKFSRMHEACRR